MEKFDCAYIDEWGFCKAYTDSDVVWMCPKNADCDRYVEGEDGK